MREGDRWRERKRESQRERKKEIDGEIDSERWRERVKDRKKDRFKEEEQRFIGLGWCCEMKAEKLKHRVYKRQIFYLKSKTVNVR